MTETPVKIKVTLTQAQASRLHYLLKGEPALSDLHCEVIGGLCDAQAADRERERRLAAKEGRHLCGRCGKRGKIVNQCGCDEANLPTRVQYERVFTFSRGFAREAGMIFERLRLAGLHPTCEVGESLEATISLPVNEVGTLLELQRREPARFGNPPPTSSG